MAAPTDGDAAMLDGVTALTDAEAALRGRLRRAGQRAVAAGLALASGGNLSAKTADGAHALVTAAGAWLDDLADDAIVSVRLADGATVEGTAPPSTELPLHLACYRARPDAGAVVHLHPPHCVLLTALGHEIRRITTDHALYLGCIATLPWLPSGTEAIAAAAARALTAPDTDVAVLGHHGCVTVGADVEQAFRVAANLEEAAQAAYRALVLGDEATTIHPAARSALRRDPPMGG